MIKLKVNNKISDIKFLSELNVLEYKQLMANSIDLNVISYISAIVGYDISNSELKSNINLSEIASLIFNCETDFTKLKHPESFQVANKIELVEDLDLSNQVGNLYMYEIHKERALNEKDKFDMIDLCLYTIAILFAKERNAAEYDLIYKILLKRNWIEVLSTGFFFIQKQKGFKNDILKSFLILKIKLFLLLKGILIGVKFQLTKMIIRFSS